MVPVFPVEPFVGQRLFFKPLSKHANVALSFYGKVIGQKGKRWQVQVLNAQGKTMTFDPVTGIANPNIEKHQLAWLGAEEDFKGLNCNVAMTKAELAMKAAIAEQASRKTKETHGNAKSN